MNTTSATGEHPPIASWPRSLAAWDRAKRTLGGGVSTGLRAAMKPHPLSFVGGAGSRLTDVDGNEYVDYVLGWGPVILGHGSPALAAAVGRQLPLGATYGSGHELEYLVSERIVATVPGVEKVLYSNTGSEAFQIALRLARAATGRQRFVKFAGHYHGWTDAALVGYRPDGDGALLAPGTRGQNRRAVDDVVLAPWGDLDAAREVLADASDVAAVFLEPVLCNSGVIAPPPGYLEGLRRLCTEAGVVLVFDEVITGFRMAPGGATELYGVTPDLVILAKAIAGGFSLAAVGGRADLIDLTAQGAVHAGTYNGNPIVLAAAEATLRELSAPGRYEQLGVRGAELAAGFREAIDRLGVTMAVNQVGPVVQLGPGVDRIATFDDFLRVDQAAYDRLTVELLRRGVFVMPGGRWYLSTAHSSEDVVWTLSAFRAALAAWVEGGR